MNNENNSMGNQIPNNSQNMNSVNSVNTQFQTGVNSNVVQNQGYSQVDKIQANPNMYQQQAFQQQVNQVPIQPQMVNQNNQQSNYQNYNQNNFRPPVDNGRKSNNKKIFLIIGGIVFAILLCIVLILIFTNGSNKKTKNEYETDNYETDSYENENTNNDTTSNYGTQIYNGFEFNKIPGYTYEIDEEILNIYSSSIYMSLAIYEYNFDSIKSNYTGIVNELNNRGYITNNSKTQVVSGKELITCEISKDGVAGIYFLISSPTNNSYTFEGMVINSSYSINNNDLTKVVDVINSSKYVGNYSNYSKSFSFDYDLSNKIK